MITDAEKEGIFELKDRGYSNSRIARELGIDKKTVLKYLDEDRGEGQYPETGKAHPIHQATQGHFQPKKAHPERFRTPVIPVEKPSKRVIDQREDVEVTELEVRKEKATQELQKIQPLKEHPALVEKRAKVEVAELDIREYEARKKLQASKDEELKKIQIEREAELVRIRERQELQEEQVRMGRREKWVEGWKEWALTWGVPRGVSIPADVKFKIKDGVGKVLMDRSEHESKSDIEELVKITTQSVLDPFLNKVKAEKKSRLIQAYAFPQIESYIKTQNLEGYLNEEGKGKIREDVRDHFNKVLTGSESSIWPNAIFDFLNISLKPIKELKERDYLERVRKEREEREIREKAFWEKLKEKREKEEIGNLLEIGMSRFNHYLLANRKELGVIGAKEQERANRYLEKELREGVKGNEDDRDVEGLADKILDDFFFK